MVRLLVSDDYTQSGQQASGMLPHMPGATEKDGSIVVDGRNYVYRDYTIDINSSATTTTITMDTLVGGGSNATYTMPLMSDKNLKLQVFDPETGKQIGDTVDKTIKYTTPEMKLIKGVNALDAGGDRTYSFDDKVSKTVIGYDSSGKTPKVSGSDASGTSLVAYEFIPYLDYQNNTSKNFTFNDFKITDVLPEGAVFSQANNPAWTYDEATRTATYIGGLTYRVGNLYGTSTTGYYNSTYAKKITLNLTFPNTEEGKTIPNTADVHVSDPKKATVSKKTGVTYDPYSAYLDQDSERNATDDKSILTEVLEGRQEGNILSKERLSTQYFIDSRANRESGTTSYIVNVNAPDSTQWSDFKLTDELRDDRFVYNKINIDALDVTGTVDVMGIDESGKKVTIVSNIKKRTTAYTIPTGITQIYLKGNGPVSVTKEGTYITMRVYVSAKFVDKVLLDDDNEDSKLIRNDAILDATYANSTNKAHSTQTAYQRIKKIEAVQNVGGGGDFTLEYGKTKDLNLNATISGAQGDKFDDITYAIVLPENIGMKDILSLYDTLNSDSNKGFNADNFNLTNPNVRLDLNYKGTGRAALVFTADQVEVTGKENSTLIDLKSIGKDKLKPTPFTAVSGTIDSYLYARPHDDTQDYAVKSPDNKKYTDVLDINNNGDKSELISYKKQNYTYTPPKMLAGQKKTQGSFDNGLLLNPNISRTEKDKGSDYQFLVKNTSDSEYKNLTIFDTLPYVGDTEYTQGAEKRNSEYSMHLSGPITISGNGGAAAKVLYSTNQAPKTEAGYREFVDEASNWTDSIDDFGKVTTFKIVGVDLKTNDQLKVTFHTDVDEAAKVGQRAINSFGIHDGTTMIESNLVTTEIDEKKIEKSITKEWDDHSNVIGKRPEQLKVTIYQNGKEYKSVDLSKENADVDNANLWKYTFKDLPKYDNDMQVYVYTTKEADVPDYNSTEIKDEDGNII